MNLNSITVSACRGAFDRNTYEVNLLDWLENVRPQIPLNDYAKKQLPAIMPHGLFSTRRQDSIRVHSGLVQIDIDAKHQKKGFNVDTVLQQMQDHKNILSCGRSCGGEGVFALYLVEGIDDNMHVQAAMAVMDDVRFWFKVEPDAPVSNNLSSLRFASPYAPYINLDVTPFKLDK